VTGVRAETNALIALLLAAACSSATDPLPHGALPLDPPVVFTTWWEEVEGCSGQTADFSKVSWYYVPGDGGFSAGSSADVVGVWRPANNSITLAQYVIDNPLVVRHEMLHAILHRTDHPAEYFVDRCGVLVTY
jgi:hypothetical protein